MNRDGVAIIPAMALGSFTVTVLPPPPDPAPSAEGQPAPAAKEYPNIPSKYRAATTSPLKVEVKEGVNKFKFDLEEG